MTLLVHIVGDSDLGIDIQKFIGPNRVEMRKKRIAVLERFCGRGDAESAISAVVDLDFGDGTRSQDFMNSPLGSIFERLHDDAEEGAGSSTGDNSRLHILLLGSTTGKEGTETAAIARALGKAFTAEGAGRLLEEKYGRRVTCEVFHEADLQEGACFPQVQDRVRTWFSGHPADSAIVTSIGGATRIVFMAMGAVDGLGVPWRLALVAERGESKARMGRLEDYPEAVTHWLRSLGHVQEARANSRREAGAAGMGGRPEEEVRKEEALLRTLERAEGDPWALSADDLGLIVALEMVRADIGAAIPLRAWVEKQFVEMRDREGPAVLSALPEELRRPYGVAGMLGPLITAAKKHMAKNKGAGGAAAWLARQKQLNRIGIQGTHYASAPTYTEALSALKGELALYEQKLPTYVKRPWQRTVLYIAACGRRSDGELITERVLRASPDAELLQALPGAGLTCARPPSPAFLLLHSGNEESCAVAKQNADAARALRADARPAWGPTARAATICYSSPGGGAAESEGRASTIADRVEAEILAELEEINPAAVVLWSTGEKPVVIGTFLAVQKWCLEHAAPLFLQSHVEGSGGQYHRIGLRRDSREALLTTAASAMRSFNFLEAVRILRAGDEEMDRLSDRCKELGSAYANAVSAEDPDAHAARILDVLTTIAALWGEDLDWIARSRLVVVASEVTSFKRNRVLIVRNTSLGRRGGEGERIILAGAQQPIGRSGGERMANHKDLLEVLARVRNSIIFTHGNHSVEEVLHRVLNEANIQVPAEFTYRDLLERTAGLVRAAAGTKKYPALGSSCWADEFRDTLNEMTGG